MIVFLLGLSALAFNQWQINNQLQSTINQEMKKKDGDFEIKSLKKIKSDKQSFYYFSPLKNNKKFYNNNLPLSLYQEKVKDKEEIFIRPVIKKTPLKGVNLVTIHKITYKHELFKLAKSSDKVISHYHIKEDFSPFNLSDLVSGHMDKLAKEVGKHSSGKSFDKSLASKLTEEGSLLSDYFDLSEDKLVLEDKLKIPYKDLFDVVDAKLLEGDLKQEYDLFVSKKKEEEAKRKNEKLVALTFDDGPNPDTTPQVLSLLDKYQAKATFFMMGSKISGNESLVKKIISAGHEIGNHSWDHPDLTKLSEDQVRFQIRNTNDAIAKACGKVPIYLRPPYGATNDNVRRISGLTEVLWTVDTRDWENHNTEAIMANIRSQLQPGGIILMHDIHQTSVNALPTVLDYLKSQGYKCVTVSQVMGH
nr:polysaccharide deacetylase family protein [Streptococcus catagoni]